LLKLNDDDDDDDDDELRADYDDDDDYELINQSIYLANCARQRKFNNNKTI